MLAFTGHEWRNQLSLLNLAIAKLERSDGQPLDAEQQNTIKRIRQCSAALQRISRSFLDQSRAEGASFTPHPILLDPVQDVIEPVLFSYTDFLSNTGQIYQIKNRQAGILVWADRNLLLSVYDNLIGNAIRYGEPGGKIVLNVLEHSNEHELSVWNSGPGVATENLEFIFERFTSAAETETSNGIGLFLAREIVEAHNGRLWADSIPGVWVNFILTLPKRGTTQAISSH